MLSNGEKNKNIVEVYTKHIEVSAQILQTIKNLNTDIKNQGESFKSIEKHFNRIIEELEYLKIYLEKSVKNHDTITAGRYEKLMEYNCKLKDDFTKFYVILEKVLESIKNKINFTNLAWASVLLAIIGMLVKFIVK